MIHEHMKLKVGRLKTVHIGRSSCTHALLSQVNVGKCVSSNVIQLLVVLGLGYHYWLLFVDVYH